MSRYPGRSPVVGQHQYFPKTAPNAFVSPTEGLTTPVHERPPSRKSRDDYLSSQRRRDSARKVLGESPTSDRPSPAVKSRDSLHRRAGSGSSETFSRKTGGRDAALNYAAESLAHTLGSTPSSKPSSKFLGDSFDITSSSGVVGLANLGNTCFMNSILQCLSNTPPLRKFFCQVEYEHFINRHSRLKGRMVKAFARLIRRMWSGASHGCERPSEVKDIVGKIAPRFIGFDQQDSHEFLSFLLDGLHDDLNQIHPKPPYKEIKDIAGETERQTSEKWWAQYCSREESPIKSVFCGQLRSQVICKACKNVSTCFDPFWDVSVPIPAKYQTSHHGFSRSGGYGTMSSRYSRYGSGYGGISTSSSRFSATETTCPLEECFAAYSALESLGSEDAYYCSKCKAHQPADKQLFLFRLPAVLVVHIKRFSASRFRKLSTAVQLPLAGFDVRPYCHPDAVLPDDGVTTYKLIGVTNHSGSTLGGHYVADCVNEVSGQWHNFSDSFVSKSSPPKQSSAAYVLFLQRESASAGEPPVPEPPKPEPAVADPPPQLKPEKDGLLTRLFRRNSKKKKKEGEEEEEDSLEKLAGSLDKKRE